jgi:hypothetical protein
MSEDIMILHLHGIKGGVQVIKEHIIDYWIKVLVMFFCVDVMVKLVRGFGIGGVIFQCEDYEFFVVEVRELHFLRFLLRGFGNGVHLQINAV